MGKRQGSGEIRILILCCFNSRIERSLFMSRTRRVRWYRVPEEAGGGDWAEGSGENAGLREREIAFSLRQTRAKLGILWRAGILRVILLTRVVKGSSGIWEGWKEGCAIKIMYMWLHHIYYKWVQLLVNYTSIKLREVIVFYTSSHRGWFPYFPASLSSHRSGIIVDKLLWEICLDDCVRKWQDQRLDTASKWRVEMRDHRQSHVYGRLKLPWTRGILKRWKTMVSALFCL